MIDTPLARTIPPPRHRRHGHPTPCARTPGNPPAPPSASAPPASPGDTPHGGDPHLHPDRIIATIKALGDRIEERFPGSGLGRLARQQLGIARNTLAQVEWAQKPILWVRAGVGVVILLVVALVKIGNAKARIDTLEREVQQLQRRLLGVEARAPDPTAAAAPTARRWFAAARRASARTETARSWLA